MFDSIQQPPSGRFMLVADASHVSLGTGDDKALNQKVIMSYGVRFTRGLVV